MKHALGVTHLCDEVLDEHEAGHQARIGWLGDAAAQQARADELDVQQRALLAGFKQPRARLLVEGGCVWGVARSETYASV